MRSVNISVIAKIFLIIFKEEIFIYSPKLQVSLAIGAAAPEDEFRKGWD